MVGRVHPRLNGAGRPGAPFKRGSLGSFEHVRREVFFALIVSHPSAQAFRRLRRCRYESTDQSIRPAALVHCLARCHVRIARIRHDSPNLVGTSDMKRLPVGATRTRNRGKGYLVLGLLVVSRLDIQESTQGTLDLALGADRFGSYRTGRPPKGEGRRFVRQRKIRALEP